MDTTAPAPSAAGILSDDGAGAASPIVSVRGLRRTYGTGEAAVRALDGVTFDVGTGELVAVVGRSGSGKTTLLNVVGGLDAPDEGSVLVAGQEVTSLDEAGLDTLRRDVVGFVFQSFGLVPTLTATENVGIPLRLRGVPVAEREERVRLLLDLVGLSGHAAQRPGEMSGGQQQRVAIARALASSPRLLVADEPTGQLDSETGLAVMGLLRGIVDAEGMTILVATHDPTLMALADRVLYLQDGKLTESGCLTSNCPRNVSRRSAG